MSVFSKQRVAVAHSGHSQLDLSCDHITSMDWMTLQPVYYRHTIPGEHISIDPSQFTRCEALVLPSYLRARLNLRAFFVPFRTVYQQFDAMKADTVGYGNNSSGVVSGSPYTDTEQLTYLLCDQLVSTVVTTGSYDFAMNGDLYKFTVFGRRVWKILLSLGYRFPLYPKSGTPIEISMLALLAYARVYCDWFWQSQYLNDVNYHTLMQWFSNNDVTPLYFSASDLLRLFQFVEFVNYDADYFTGQWDNPVGPNNGNFGGLGTLPDVTLQGSLSGNVQMTTNGTPTMVQNSSTSLGIGSQYLHDILKYSTDYMKRHQLSTARVVDRMLVDFGINLKSENIKRSQLLQNHSFDLQIGDVMSHADSGSSVLGDYAGRGYIAGDCHLEYDCEEFGLLLIVASILPSGGYVQGIDRNNLHITKLDFFDKTFDNLSVQSCPPMEVFIPEDDTFAPVYNDWENKTFGFVQRYAEYKRPQSWLSGKYALPSQAGVSAWHGFRLFGISSFGTIANLKHDSAFCRGLDSDQYNRIFYYDRDLLDPFNVVFHFDVKVHAPCKSLFDSYDFEFDKNSVVMEAAGVKAN